MKNTTQIQCPECKTLIDVNDILKHQLEESLRKEFQDKHKREKGELERSLKDKWAEESAEEMKLLLDELKEKSAKVKEFNKAQARISQLEREKNEMRSELEVETQKKLNTLLLAERDKVRKQEEDKNELKFKELEKQLEDQKKLTEEMKRKQEQGSMQLQGEAQELAMEDWLQQTFPLDTIDEVKKGANGADCLQIVNTREQQNCGKIYYESKRTKAFQTAWIEKFKNDIRDKNAHIGVLVTEVMPADMERMGMKEGIWICTYEEFKGLSAVLRQSVIQINNAVISQENKGDKMVMLYDFLTSNEFKLQVEGIVEGFTQMQNDLISEKNSMNRIWKQREKQIQKVVANTINMYGSIKGIAGNAVQPVLALELESETKSYQNLKT